MTSAFVRSQNGHQDFISSKMNDFNMQIKICIIRQLSLNFVRLCSVFMHFI